MCTQDAALLPFMSYFLIKYNKRLYAGSAYEEASTEEGIRQFPYHNSVYSR